MIKNIVIDLETLDTRPTALILSIGAACVEDPDFSFSALINVSKDNGGTFTINPDTVLWWLAQSEEARAEIISSRERGIHIGEALSSLYHRLTTNFGPNDSLLIWGNGASFDNTILRNAYDKMSLICPWKYSQDRCYRTLRNIHPVEVPFEGTRHSALADARYQASVLREIVKTYGIKLI